MFLEVIKHQPETDVTVLAMHHYHFQYYSQRAALTMMAGCLVVFLAAVFIVMGQSFFEKNIFALLLTVAAPTLLFYGQRHRVVKEGEAELGDNFVRIAIQGREENVNFFDLKSYRIDHHNGATLTLHFRDGRSKLKVGANGIYSDPGEFERFCNHFERVLIVYNRDVANKVVRRTPFLLHSYMLLWLVVLSVAVIAEFVVSMGNGRVLKGSFYTMLLTVLGFWWARYAAGEKEKRYRRAVDELDPVHH